MGYSYLQKPHSERGREFKVSPICLRTAVSAAQPSEHILSDTAKPLWEARHDEIENRVMTEPSDLLRGTYAKAEGIAGRNALIVHRAIAAQQGVVPELAISGEVMAMAIEWTQWELGQTLLEYQRLGLTDNPESQKFPAKPIAASVCFTTRIYLDVNQFGTVQKIGAIGTLQLRNRF